MDSPNRTWATYALVLCAINYILARRFDWKEPDAGNLGACLKILAARFPDEKVYSSFSFPSRIAAKEKRCYARWPRLCKIGIKFLRLL